MAATILLDQPSRHVSRIWAAIGHRNRRTRAYIRENQRQQFFAQLPSDDHKYLDFQLWQEGIARYTQIKAAELARNLEPIPEYAALADYESFAHYAAHVRRDTLRRIDISKSRRDIVYSWGAAEGLLLDRLNPGWRDQYFKHPFSLQRWFEVAR